jgi:two-component sensor histidine kinase
LQGASKLLRMFTRCLLIPVGLSAELSTIATRELAPYSEKGKMRVRIAGPQVLLEPNPAQSIAVILHELSTNAAKYGALSTADGRVELNGRARQTGAYTCVGRSQEVRQWRSRHAMALAGGSLNK